MLSQLESLIDEMGKDLEKEALNENKDDVKYANLLIAYSNMRGAFVFAREFYVEENTDEPTQE